MSTRSHLWQRKIYERRIFIFRNPKVFKYVNKLIHFSVSNLKYLFCHSKTIIKTKNLNENN